MGSPSTSPQMWRMPAQRSQTRFDSKNYTVLPDSGTASRCKRRLRALIVILDTDDVVLAEIAPGLNLDQFQQNLAGIFQPVDGADRDIDRFVLVYDLDRLVDRHPRGAPHHDPVLGAMVMFLQREPPARLDDDALDLVTIAIVDRLIGAP